MIRPLFILLCATLFAGCASSKRDSADLRIPPSGYSAVFSAARETLTARRFELERIDARAGVITTRPKSSSGLATPWDTEQSTLGGEFEDLLNRQQRIVRITFEPAQAPGSPAAPPQPEDLRAYEGELTARVQVVIERLHRPGWQVEPGAVRFSSYTQDPALSERQMWPAYAVPFSQDPELAARIAAEIEKRMNTRAAAKD